MFRNWSQSQSRTFSRFGIGVRIEVEKVQGSGSELESGVEVVFFSDSESEQYFFPYQCLSLIGSKIKVGVESWSPKKCEIFHFRSFSRKC